MTDIALYRIAQLARYEAEQHQRNIENPRDYPWTSEDLAILEQTWKYFYTLTPPFDREFNPEDEKFYAALLEYIQEIIENYQQFSSKSNLPPPDVLASYEKYLVKIRQQSAYLETRLSSYRQARENLIAKLKASLPQAPPELIEEVVDSIGSHLAEDKPEIAFAEAVQTLSQTYQVFGEPTTTAPSIQAVVTVTELDPVFEETSPIYQEVKAAALSTTTTIAPENVDAATTLATLATATAFSQTTTPAPIFSPATTTTLEAALLPHYQSPSKAAETSTLIAAHSSDLSSLSTSLSNYISTSQKVEQSLLQDFQKAEVKPNESQITTNWPTIKYSIIFNYTLNKVTEKSGIYQKTDSKVRETTERILRQLGITSAENLTLSHLPPIIRQALLRMPISLYKTIEESPETLFTLIIDPEVSQAVQETLSEPTVSTPEPPPGRTPKTSTFLQIANDIRILGSKEAIDVADVLSMASKHINLDNIDKWVESKLQTPEVKLDIWLTKKLGLPILGKLIPELAPFIKILGTVYGITHLAFEKMIFIPLFKLRNILVGFLAARVGLEATAYISTSLLLRETISFSAKSISNSLSYATTKVNSAVSTTGTILINSFISFLATFMIIFLSIPIITALFLFIINSSAFLVPPSGLISGGPYTGPLPEGCPTVWPLDSSIITQGAWVTKTADTYHGNTEALDMRAHIGNAVKATHKGIAIPKHEPTGYGYFLDVYSACEYKGQKIEFLSRYAHLSAYAPGIGPQTLVEQGQVIGYSGNSGTKDAHLHYEFRRGDNNRTHFEEDIAPFMWPNFIPKEIERGCSNVTDCNNTSIP